MDISIVMPKIGLTMTEGKIVEWKKDEGDSVEKGEVLFVFETEKVTIEFEAQHNGTLQQKIAKYEDVVPVGEKVAIISDGASKPDGKTVMPELKAVDGAAKSEAKPVAETSSVPDASVKSVLPTESAPTSSDAAASGKIRATPLARRMAKDHGLDLAAIAEQALGNRVRSADVKKALAHGIGTKVSGELVALADGARSEAGRLVKLSGMRRVIAEKMVASKVQTAQAYMTLSIDASNIKAVREKLLPEVETETGFRATITDILIKITACAIAKHPVMNTQWTNEGVLWLDNVHMGLATALDDGLIVPVIANADQKSIGEIAVARNDIVSRARAGTLTPDEMRGSTFTLSSLGMYGIEEFNSIINQPESAILAIGTIIDKPIAIEGELTVRPMMKITLTYDHRVIDGAKAAGFMQTLKKAMEDPILVIA